MLRKAPLLLGLASALFLGCGSSRPDRGAELARLGSLCVAPVISGSMSDAGSRLEDAVQASAARVLAARGYAVVSEAGAQGTVRVAWILGRDISPEGREERTLSLSLSIFSRSGERLYSGRSAQVLPERMWSEDRAASEVAQMLRDVPDCKPAVVPATGGKPALAPIRLR